MAPSLSPTELQDALSDPAAYPHDPDRIEFEHTHISLVALAAPWVYKIKKPVELGFLDFSSLQQRHHYCQEEVRLNRRLCAPIYEGVVPVVRTNGGLRVNGDEDAGTVVEYAVKMKMLDRSRLLDARIGRDDIDSVDVDRVAQRLCEFYEQQTSTPEIAEAGRIDQLRVSTQENFDQTADRVGVTISKPAYEALQYYTDRFFDQNAALLNRRRAGGCIVDGHGDLRLEHVHLSKEQVCIYDCIEFNDRFRHLDVANDVAFLAMDFDLHGRPDLGRRFVKRVAEATDDPELEDVIDFYKSYRSYVRGKVEGMRSEETDVPPAERGDSHTRAQRHFQLALRYAVAGMEPLVVVIMGQVGTGKSTQAEALSHALGWAHVSSDRVRKSHAGASLLGRADERTRERLYTEEMSDLTYNTLCRRALERAKRRSGTVLDATFGRRKHRDQLRSTLGTTDVPYVFVEMTAPDDVLRDRLAARSHAGATVSDARLEDFDMLAERYEAPDALEDARHVRINSDADADDTTLAILKTLMRLNDDPT